MIIVTTSLVALPILFAICALDSILFLAALRLLLGRLSAIGQSPAYVQLRSLISLIEQGIADYIESWVGRPLPLWVIWFLIVIVNLGLRAILIAIAPSGIR